MCPPSSEPIAQGLPGSPSSGDQGIIFSLAEATPYRVDRGQVEDIETHLSHPRDLGRRGPEAPEAAREQFVPGPHRRPLPVDPDRQWLGDRRVATQAVPRQSVGHRRRQGGLDTAGVISVDVKQQRQRS